MSDGVSIGDDVGVPTGAGDGVGIGDDVGVPTGDGVCAG